MTDKLLALPGLLIANDAATDIANDVRHSKSERFGARIVGAAIRDMIAVELSKTANTRDAAMVLLKAIAAVIEDEPLHRQIELESELFIALNTIIHARNDAIIHAWKHR